MKNMFCAIFLACLSTISSAQEWKQGASDWQNLPAVKQSKQALYLTPQQAYELVQKEGKNILFLDIRTRSEAMYVGMPSLVDALVPYVEHQEIMGDWDEKRNIYVLEPNVDFPKEVERRMLDKGLDKNARIILICRSGDRSAKAADLLGMTGFKTVYSIAEGFEGDMGKDGSAAGRRTINGWKNANLPWSYKLERAKMYFSK